VSRKLDSSLRSRVQNGELRLYATVCTYGESVAFIKDEYEIRYDRMRCEELRRYTILCSV